MERTQSKLEAELKEQKEIEITLRNSRDSIELQLKEKSQELEKAQVESGGNKELKGKLSEKENELHSIQKTLEKEKAAKSKLEKDLSETQKSIDKQEKDIEVLETANQVMGAELEELRIVQEEFFTHSIQLEDTQHELESLGIANEQLMADIKEKNYLVEEAKEKTTRYEQMDLPIFTLDQDGAILSWNQTAESLTGYISELTLNQSISFLFADKDSFDFEKQFQIPLKENSKHRLEIPIKKFDGEIFNGLISLTSFKDRNGIITTLGYLTNLSDSKNDDEIKSIKRKFTTLLGDSGLILLNLSPDFLISDMNEKTESIFQWERENVLNQNFFEVFFPQENWQEVSSDIEGRMSTQASVDLETENQLNDKTSRYFLWNLIKEINPEDESTQGFLAVGQDVTDLHNAQNKLRENDFLLKSTVDKAVLLEGKLKETEEKSKETNEKLKESEKKLKESQEHFQETLNAKQYQFEDALKSNDKQKMVLREEKLNMVEHITSAVVDLVNNPIQGIANILGQVKKQAEMAEIHKGLVTVAINECRRVADLIGKLKNFQPPTKKNLDSLDVHQILDEIIQKHMDGVKDRTVILEKKLCEEPSCC